MRRSLTLPALVIVAGCAWIGGICAGAELEVERLHRNRSDVVSLHFDGEFLYGRTSSGATWSVSERHLDDAVRGRHALLFTTLQPRGVVTWEGNLERSRRTAGKDLPSTRRGCDVTAARWHEGELLLSTFGCGLVNLEGESIVGDPADVRDLEIVGDRLVMATGNGLTVLRQGKLHSLAIEGPPHDNVSSFAWDGASLWTGYFDGGLARYRENRWESVSIPGPPAASWVNTLCWDGASLWIGTEDGLYRWREADGVQTVELPFGQVGRIQSVRNDGGILVIAGSRWVAFRQGGRWEKFDLSWDSLQTAFAWQGEIYAGGMAGVLRREGDRWRRYSQLNGSLPDSWVTAVAPVGKELWVGTYDAGLGVLRSDGTWHALQPSAWVNFNAVQVVAPFVAVGTMEEGLLLYDRSVRKWRRMLKKDGLPSDDVTAALRVGKTIWIGTRGGVAELALRLP